MKKTAWHTSINSIVRMVVIAIHTFVSKFPTNQFDVLQAIKKFDCSSAQIMKQLIYCERQLQNNSDKCPTFFMTKFQVAWVCDDAENNKSKWFSVWPLKPSHSKWHQRFYEYISVHRLKCSIWIYDDYGSEFCY